MHSHLQSWLKMCAFFKKLSWDHLPFSFLLIVFTPTDETTEPSDPSRKSLFKSGQRPFFLYLLSLSPTSPGLPTVFTTMPFEICEGAPANFRGISMWKSISFSCIIIVTLPTLFLDISRNILCSFFHLYPTGFSPLPILFTIFCHHLFLPSLTALLWAQPGECQAFH